MRRWQGDLGLSGDRIIETATETQRDHPAPPDCLKALDRAMERAARRGAQSAAASPKPPTCRSQTKRADAPRPSENEKAAFFADLVNFDRYLPANTITNTICEAMLSRGLVTPERLRERGVR